MYIYLFGFPIKAAIGIIESQCPIYNFRIKRSKAFLVLFSLNFDRQTQKIISIHKNVHVYVYMLIVVV